MHSVLEALMEVTGSYWKDTFLPEKSQIHSKDTVCVVYLKIECGSQGRPDVTLNY